MTQMIHLLIGLIVFSFLTFKAANETWQQYTALAFFGFLSVYLIGYVFWNVKIRKKSMRRKAKEDEAKFRTGEVTKKDLSQGVVPHLISTNASLAGMSFAALFIVLALIIFKFHKFSPLEQKIMWFVLAGSAIATISWLFCLEHLTQMLSPSITSTRMFQFYHYSMFLWIISLILITTAILLFLLLANSFVAMAVAFVTSLIALKYWKIHNEW